MLFKRLFISILVVIPSLLLISSVVLPEKASALSGSQFDAGRIMDDALFYKPGTLSVSQMQNFFNAKRPSCDTNGTKSKSYYYNSSTGRINDNRDSWVTTTRATYGQRYDAWHGTDYAKAPYICLKDINVSSTPEMLPVSGICDYLPSRTNQSAAQIIKRVTDACGVNPKVMIVLLQKEQGLVTDDWPWKYQRRYATGFCVPDGPPPPACEGTYGFFKQVYYAAKQFKLYRANPGNYNYVAGQNNNIPYNPNGACGSSGVFIVNQATAGLYNYTPYQPNQAALDNLYGSGDGCSAYGNRNFWRYYNDWFGPTQVDVVRARKDNGDPTQFVIYGGVKQGVPNNDVLYAWGIDKLPLSTYPANTIDNIPYQGNGILSRYMRSTSTSRYYFIDGQKYFQGKNSQVRDVWGFPSVPNVASSKLFKLLANGGALSPYFSPESSSSLGIIDKSKGILFSSPTAFHAWRNKERVITLSDRYYNGLTTTATGHNRISNSGNSFAVVDGTRLSIPASMSTSYPYSGSEILVSDSLLNYFSSNGQLNRFVRSDYSGAVYMLNSGELFGMPNMTIWNSYAGGGSKTASNLGKAPFDLLTKSGVLRTTIVERTSDSTYYVLNESKAYKIPPNLEDNYDAPNKSLVLDEVHFSNFGDMSTPVAPFVTSRASPAVFLLDAGVRRGISNPATLRQLKKPNESITLLTNNDLKSYAYTDNLTNYLTDGVQRYFLDAGSKHPTSAAIAAEWGLPDSKLKTVDANTISDFVTSPDPLSRVVSTGTKTFLVTKGRHYEVISPYETLWGISIGGDLTLTHDSLFRVKDGGILSRFAARNGTIYTVDRDGTLIGIPSLDALFNIGYRGHTIVKLSDSFFTAMGGSAEATNGFLFKDASTDACYILDNGAKREPSAESKAEWCFDTANTTTLSSSYLNLLLDGSNLTKSIRAEGDSAIYAIDESTKRWIPSNQIYYDYFSPFSSVSKHLKNTMPNGAKVNPDGS